MDIVGCIRGEDGSGGLGSIRVHVIRIVRITSSSFSISFVGFHDDLTTTGLIYSCIHMFVVPLPYRHTVTEITMTAAAISAITAPLTPTLTYNDRIAPSSALCVGTAGVEVAPVPGELHCFVEVYTAQDIAVIVWKCEEESKAINRQLPYLGTYSHQVKT